MTHEEYLKWLDREITVAKEQAVEQSYDLSAVEYCKGWGEACMEAKKKFLTLTPPPTTLS